MKRFAINLIAGAFWAGFLPAFAQENPAALDHLTFTEPAGTYWALPKELKDVSGMALAPDGRLFVHEEERAIIHEIDYAGGTIVKTFSFGRPAEKKDFEGMAIAGQRFFIINEKGTMLEGREGFNGEGKVFNTHDTGFGDDCEIEGLAATDAKVLILCRKAERDDYKRYLTIFSWDIATKTPDEDPFLKISLTGEAVPPALAKIAPSGLDVLENGHLLVLSADPKLVFEVTPEGEFTGVWELNKKWHDNPEGIALAPEGYLIIADEGGPATLQVYGLTSPEKTN